jgi:hypothetical protein
MEYDAGQMVPQRVQPPEGVIRGMGQPGKRVPVGHIEIQKCPLEKRTVKRTDMGICQNIDIIIPVDKFIPERCEIYEKRYQSN